MSNRTYICTKCRSSRRAEAAGGLKTELRCSTCRGELWELSPKWCIPPRTDDTGWNDLKAAVEASRPFRRQRLLSRMHEEGGRLLTEIDWQTGIIQRQPPSPAREAALQRLALERTEALALSQHTEVPPASHHT
jgi:hypothetical protein